MSLKSLRQFVEAKIKEFESDLESEKEDRGVTDESFGYYECGLASDGIPNSHGNSDDVYSDGFHWGSMVGEEDGYLEVLKKIRELEGDIDESK